LGDLGEEGIGLLDLLLVVQRLKQHAFAAGPDSHQVFLAAQRQLAETNPLGLAHSVADDAERVLGELVSGREEIGGVVVERRDFGVVDELNKVERFLGFELHRFEFVVVEQHVLALFVFVALADILGIHRADALDHLLVMDALAGRLVDLIEGRGSTGFVSRKHLHIDRNEAQAKLALPYGTRCGHLLTLSRT